jgi:hypothetical protein
VSVFHVAALDVLGEQQGVSERHSAHSIESVQSMAAVFAGAPHMIDYRV